MNRIYIKPLREFHSLFCKMSTFKLSTTQRNKPLLLCKGFCDTIDKIAGDKIYWKCEFVRTLKCKGRVHPNSINTMIFRENNDHDHLVNAVLSEVQLFEEKIRDPVVNYNESTHAVIDNCLDNLSDDTVARIPKFKHIKKNIQNLRHKNNLRFDAFGEYLGKSN